MTNDGKYSETELISLLKQGNEDAFRMLFDVWHKKLFHFSFRYTKSKEQAEEIVQDTLLTLWMNRIKLDERYPLGPYLYTISKRKSLNVLRLAATSQKTAEILWRNFNDAVNTTEEAVHLSELEELTEKALQNLSAQQQIVFRLSKYEGLSHQEIAERLDISKETVKKHSAEALKTLRIHLKKHGLAYLMLVYTCLPDT
jgi:RNA polymerase sigma-70 factor (family 1)